MNQNEKKKLTLSIRNIESLESRVTPNTICPSTKSSRCCVGSKAYSEKLTAVAFF